MGKKNQFVELFLYVFLRTSQVNSLKKFVILFIIFLNEKFN